MKAAPNLHLKFNHMRLVAAIAERGQIGLAARDVALTQPAASRMLSEIEAIIGSPLFIRNPRGLDPTPIGFAIAKRAQTMLLEMQDLLQEVESLRQGETGTASAGAVTGGALGFLVPAIRRLKASSPNAELAVEVGPSDEMIRHLLDGTLDFALARVPSSVDPREFDVIGAKTESVRFVVREDHPLAGRSQIELGDLAGLHWVIQSAGTPIRIAVENAYRAARIDLPLNITNTTSLLVMMALTSSSDAICPVAKEVADLLMSERVAARFATLDLATPIIVSPYYLLNLKKRRLSPLAERLKALVIEELERG